jgi:hypothetical protein
VGAGRKAAFSALQSIRFTTENTEITEKIKFIFGFSVLEFLRALLVLCGEDLRG